MNAATPEAIGSASYSYRRLFELGRGGMARVYLAESLASGVRKLVVLKVLNPEFCASASMRASFRREAELSAQMNHPNVVQVMEVLDGGEVPVIVMEYLDGVSLSLLRRQCGKELPLRLHMYILTQVLAGLHHVHELTDLDGTPLNAVHRDVSPQNVMVLHDGPVKVLDFGIAKVHDGEDQGEITLAGVIKGKPHYMAPEQMFWEGGIDRRADVFAVGVMLWEAVTGQRMWRDRTEAELFRSLATGRLPRVQEFATDVPCAALEIVERALSADRERRYTTAREMQLAIEDVLTQQRWQVHAHELADFMLQHFGEIRRATELKVKAALRNFSQSGVRLVRDSDGPTVQTADDRTSRAIPTNWREWGVALACIGSLALLGASVLRGPRRAPSGVAERRAPETIALEVDALPPGAEILLDGRRLGTDHFREAQPMTHRKAVLEVRAPGYVSEQQEVLLSTNTTIRIVLEPEPALAAVPAAAAAAGPAAAVPAAAARAADASGSASVASGDALSGIGPRARPPGSAQATNRPPLPFPRSAPRNCTPPYFFSADGIKTYKPECF